MYRIEVGLVSKPVVRLLNLDVTVDCACAHLDGELRYVKLGISDHVSILRGILLGKRILGAWWVDCQMEIKINVGNMLIYMSKTD